MRGMNPLFTNRKRDSHVRKHDTTSPCGTSLILFGLGFTRNPRMWTLVKILLATDGVYFISKHSKRETAMWWGARNGNVELVKELLAMDAQSDSPRMNGETML